MIIRHFPSARRSIVASITLNPGSTNTRVGSNVSQSFVVVA